MAYQTIFNCEQYESRTSCMLDTLRVLFQINPNFTLEEINKRFDLEILTADASQAYSQKSEVGKYHFRKNHANDKSWDIFRTKLKSEFGLNVATGELITEEKEV